MTLYLVYAVIPADEFNSCLKYLISNTETFGFRYNKKKLTGLYAWTTKKKLLKRFLSYRDKSIYRVKEREFDSMDDIKHFCNNEKLLKIQYYKFETVFDKKKKEPRKIRYACTANEYYQIHENKSENIMDYIVERNSIKFDYALFKDKIQEALDYLCYTILYDTFITNDRDRIIAGNDILDYGMTPLSNDLCDIFYFICNEEVLFKYFFRYMIYGV